MLGVLEVLVVEPHRIAEEVGRVDRDSVHEAFERCGENGLKMGLLASEVRIGLCLVRPRTRCDPRRGATAFRSSVPSPLARGMIDQSSEAQPSLRRPAPTTVPSDQVPAGRRSTTTVVYSPE